ncbi:MAG TPA: helix-turn-helix domain-containing protein [Gemmatimonadaceae bacterium]|nr:helix-turn-helix domain-containing protein [Gemmatimonadaceae bacterium]
MSKAKAVTGAPSPIASQIRLGEWLATVRERHGFVQRDGAEFLKTDAQKLSRWERGMHPMPAHDFLALVVRYGAVEDLFKLLGTWERATRVGAGGAAAGGGEGGRRVG